MPIPCHSPVSALLQLDPMPRRRGGCRATPRSCSPLTCGGVPPTGVLAAGMGGSSLSPPWPALHQSPGPGGAAAPTLCPPLCPPPPAPSFGIKLFVRPVCQPVCAVPGGTLGSASAAPAGETRWDEPPPQPCLLRELAEWPLPRCGAGGAQPRRGILRPPALGLLRLDVALTYIPTAPCHRLGARVSQGIHLLGTCVPHPA